MKSLYRKSTVDGDSVLHYLDTDVELPVPEKNEILVQVKAASVSCIDYKIVQEIFRRSPREHYPVGHDVCGVVSKIGSAITNVDVGDEVVGVLPLDSRSSGCAEYCIFGEYDIVKKPDMLGAEEAAAGIGDAVRAYTALHYQARLCGGDTILIMDGASAFGIIAIQLSQLWGAKVITTVTTDEEKGFLDTMQPPVAQIIEMSEKNSILVSSVMDETGALGVDCILDNTVRLFTNDENGYSDNYKPYKPHKHDIISCLGVGGKWITSQFDMQLDPPDCQQLFMRSASVCFLFDQAWTLSYSQHGRYQHILQDAVDKMDRGQLRPKINKIIQLEDAVETLQELDNIKVGKVIVKL